MQKTLFEIAKSNLGPILVELGLGTSLRNILPLKKVYEDDLVFAFYHPKHYWEKHIVIVPKTKISVLDQVTDQELKIVSHIFEVSVKLVKDFGWDKTNYRLVTNGGSLQKVKYLHFHLSSGRQIGKDDE